MVGILLLSHGRMAEGMLDSCKLFFGEDLEKIKAICLLEGDDPEAYDEKIKEAIAELDEDGHGIIAFCDLLGGTPFNRCAFNFVNDRFVVIPGMNFAMLLELMGQRMYCEDLDDIDVDTLVETGRNGIINYNSMMPR